MKNRIFLSAILLVTLLAPPLAPPAFINVQSVMAGTTICGQYIRKTWTSGFEFEYYLFVTSDGAFAISREPSFQDGGYYRLYDAVIKYEPVLFADGTRAEGSILSWSNFEQISGLQDCVQEPPTQPSVQIPTPTPTIKTEDWLMVVCGQWEVAENKWIKFAYFPWNIQNVWYYDGDPTIGGWDLWSLNGRYAVIFFPWLNPETGNLSGFARMVLTNDCTQVPPAPMPIPSDICGTLVMPYSVPQIPDEFGGGGMGPLFIPFGKEDDPYWFQLHHLGVYVKSLDTYWFYDDIEDGQNLVLRGAEGSGDVITTIEEYELVASCGPITPIPSPTPASPVLEVTDFHVEPAQVSVFELVRITMVIENRGTPLGQPFGGYTGEVVLVNESGEVIDRHTFAKGDASFINPVVEDGRVNPEKWLLTVKVRFDEAVSNGRVVVSLQPDVQQSELIVGEGRLTVNPGLSGLTCASVIANKLVGPFSPDIGKALDIITAELQAVQCSMDGDIACAVPPIVKGFVKILGRAKLGEIGKIIIGIWGVFDTDALQVCRDPVNWMLQLVREFNRQGVPISVSSVHSPMTILVTNSSGQRAGFISDDEVVTEIPDSQVIEWEGDKYVIYPSSPDITISLQATGEGAVSVSLIDGQSGREISYVDVPVSDGDKAQIDISDPQNRLVIDTNDDGNPDKVYSPGKIEMLHVLETPTAPVPVSNPPNGICGGSIGLIMLSFIALIFGHFNKPKGL